MRRELPARPRTIALIALVAALVSASAAGEALAADSVARTISEQTVSVRVPRMPTGTSMKAGIVTDAATGRALWSIHARDSRLIASTTKIMTALVAISRSRPGQTIAATAYHPDAAESVIGLRAGERMTASDLLKALLMESANDAADTLAARLAGSRGAFVSAMNRRARALGLRDTHYGNPVGLDTPRTVSSARDLAKLTAVAMREPRFSSIVGRRRATLRSGARVRHITNRNKLLQDYDWVEGVKTGHTLRAGYLLVGAASKLDARVISVVMGEPTESGRWNDSLKLLRFGRKFFKPVRAVRARRALTELPVALQDRTAEVYAERTVEFALRDGERYKVVLTTPKELEGPLAAGARVGTVIVTRNGRKYNEAAVFLRDAVPAPPVQAVLLHQLQRLIPAMLILSLVFMIGLLLMRRRARLRPQGIGRAAARPHAP
ncbi:MAG: D-alanyl-D-alanine carboxypeptidase [Actinobacteria bacterium]|nr:D-alanyl-D-alanine carboxypeptidase [Actinomycetota bacterium]